VSPRPVDIRPDPEALLRQAQAAERGQLKVFLGYASGVGKSFRMFDEARRRRERGEDVVVAAVQPDVDDEVRPMVDQLETIPSRIMDGVELVDLAAVLARRPAVCVVDGLASDNPPAAAHPTRYEDVQFLITAGISVLTAVNLEDIEEQQDFIERLTGRRKRQTVPQEFLNRADEVVVVDAPTETDDRVLSELRQRALLLAADVAERQLDEYLRLNRIQASWGTQERILVCMTPRANAAIMLASGRSKAIAWAASGILGLATVAGVLTMTIFSRTLTSGLPLAAGVTFYVAASDLIPEVNKEPGIRIAMVVFLGVGLLVVLRHYFH